MSALDVTKIVVGAHSKIEVAPWVTAKGAGTFADAGASNGGLTFEEKVEHHMVEIDQRLGPVSAHPKKREGEIKVKYSQAEIDNLRIALGKPSGSVTGTPPDFTFKSDFSATEQYYQIKVTGKGLGTTKVRTWTFWRCFAKAMAPIPQKKDSEQFFEVTFGVLEETTGSGTDSWQVVES
jgi:hypothetical protein